MLTFDLLPLARRLGCEAEVAAYTGPFVGWQFLGALLRAMPKQPADIQAVIDPVIEGMDLLAGEQDWPEARQVAHLAAASVAAEQETGLVEEVAKVVALAAAETAARTASVMARPSVDEAAQAVFWAELSGVPFARQREILLGLMEKAK